MRVVVTGGRDFLDYDRVKRQFEYATQKYGFENLVLICRIARGADSLAWQCANAFGWKDIIEFPADWTKYGKSAGHIRNAQMLTEGKPDLCLAFPGGRGTAGMVELCERAKVPIRYG